MPTNCSMTTLIEELERYTHELQKISPKTPRQPSDDRVESIVTNALDQLSQELQKGEQATSQLWALLEPLARVSQEAIKLKAQTILRHHHPVIAQPTRYAQNRILETLVYGKEEEWLKAKELLLGLKEAKNPKQYVHALNDTRLHALSSIGSDLKRKDIEDLTIGLIFKHCMPKSTNYEVSDLTLPTVTLTFPNSTKKSKDVLDRTFHQMQAMNSQPHTLILEPSEPVRGGYLTFQLSPKDANTLTSRIGELCHLHTLKVNSLVVGSGPWINLAQAISSHPTLQTFIRQAGSSSDPLTQKELKAGLAHLEANHTLRQLELGVIIHEKPALEIIRTFWESHPQLEKISFLVKNSGSQRHWHPDPDYRSPSDLTDPATLQFELGEIIWDVPMHETTHYLREYTLQRTAQNGQTTQ